MNENQINFDEYIREGEPQKSEKGYAWQTAIGLQAVDGLRPSDYLIEVARKDMQEEISIDEAKQLMRSYYQSKVSHNSIDKEMYEADMAAINIRRILAEKTFSFSLVGLLSIHRRIFEGVFEFAGQMRDYNITKKEWVLRGDTVLYVPAKDLRMTIEYDLEQERQFDYLKVDREGLVKHIVQFVSGLWQIHPFGEGNTRTIAVFTILYLRSIGFDVINDLFANHSWYFRNALVRANYQNVQKGIMRNSEFLERFFSNLLLGKNYELRNRWMLVNPSEELTVEESLPVYRTSTEQVTEQVRTLLLSLSDEQMSLKELMEKIGLKHRPSFLAKYINPATKAGLLRTIYPDKPNHPRQKYLLTQKGLTLYIEIKKTERLYFN